MRFSDEIWVPLLLGDQCVMTGGGTPSTKNISYWSGNIPWISSADVSEDFFDIKITRRITEEAITQSATKMCPPNSILLVSRVGVGKIGIYEKPVCTSQDFTNIISYPFDKYFLAFYLQRILKRKANEAQGTSIKGITSKEIKSLKLYIPTKETQFKIGNLLKLINTRIVTQNKIIRDLKAEFLFLLNNCFAGEKNATIGAYIKEESHRNKQNKGYPVFSVSNKRGFIPQNEQFDDREVASNDKTNYKIVSLNQFAYNPARINVGSIGLYKNETPCIISPMYNVFSVVSIDPFILELYFKSSYFINEMNKRLEGSVRMCLTIDGLKGIKFHLPSQTFLNSFSKAMDVLKRKIELEENLLSFYQTQKKYLLANLFI